MSSSHHGNRGTQTRQPQLLERSSPQLPEPTKQDPVSTLLKRSLKARFRTVELLQQLPPERIAGMARFHPLLAKRGPERVGAVWQLLPEVVPEPCESGHFPLSLCHSE